MIKNGEMSNYKTKEENLEIYYSFGSSVRKFVQEKIERNAIGYITHADLEKSYIEFCIKNKLVTLSNKKFFEEFKLVIGYTEDNKFNPRVNGESVRAIKGIIFRLEIEKTNKDYADNADNDALLRSKKEYIFPAASNGRESGVSPLSSENLNIEEQEPEIETDAEIQQENDAFENLEEEENQAEKDLEEIAKKMFPQEYEYPESEENQKE